MHFAESNQFKITYTPGFDSYGYNPTEKLHSAMRSYSTEIKNVSDFGNFYKKISKEFPKIRSEALKIAKEKASKTEKLI
jgi:hypothetical protein